MLCPSGAAMKLFSYGEEGEGGRRGRGSTGHTHQARQGEMGWCHLFCYSWCLLFGHLSCIEVAQRPQPAQCMNSEPTGLIIRSVVVHIDYCMNILLSPHLVPRIVTSIQWRERGGVVTQHSHIVMIGLKLIPTDIKLNKTRQSLHYASGRVHLSVWEIREMGGV